MSRFNLLLLPVIFAIIIFSKAGESGDVSKTGISAMDESFLMPVEGVSSHIGRGTIVTGRIERGIIRTGDSVHIVGLSNSIIQSKVSGIAVLNKLQNEAGKGENVDLLFSGIEVSQIKRGMVICKPRSITANTKFICEITLMKNEGSTIVTPISTSDSLQFFFHATVFMKGVIILPAGKELLPVTPATATVVLAQPIAMEKDLKFVLYDGGKIIGSGRVTAIIK